MKAAVKKGDGPSEMIEVKTVDDPVPNSKQILVEVHATDINPLDYKVRQGKFKAFFKNVTILGFDFAGIVLQVGSEVTSFNKGDKVFGMMGHEAGAHAEKMVCSEENITKMPKGVSFESAASIGMGGLTALQALRDIGKITANDKVLIIGASGGVGSMAVQLAKQTFGASVTAVASSEHRGILVELGADKTIAYDKGEPPGDEPFDIVFDVTGLYSPIEFKYTRVFISTHPSIKRFLLKIIGKSNKSVMVKPKAKDLTFLRNEIEKGNLSAHITKRFSLDKIRDAYKALETEGLAGKVVVNVISEGTKGKKNATSKKPTSTLKKQPVKTVSPLKKTQKTRNTSKPIKKSSQPTMPKKAKP